MNSTPFPSLRFALGWQFTALILVLLLPQALLGDWPWALPRGELIGFAALLAAFGGAALLNLFIRGRRDWPRLIVAIVGAAALFSLALLLLILIRNNSSRMLVLAVFAVALMLLPLPLATPRLRVVCMAVMAAVVLSVAALALKRQMQDDRAVAAQRTEFSVGTNLYNLKVIAHAGRIRPPAVRGGGLSEFGDRILLATGDGYLYRMDWNADELAVEPLPYRVPLNGEEFAAAAGRDYREPKHASEFGRTAPPGVQTWRFRTADVLVQDRGQQLRIFASHHYWQEAQKCYLLRVSMLDVQRDGRPVQDSGARWRTLFDSTPCLPLFGKDAKRGKNPFQGEEVGGRMLLLDDRTLLLTTGDLSFSGVESWQVLAQDPAASYGKTLKIDVESGSSEIFTLGHRNPQGLARAADGDLWLTEHGAKGGDELNLLKPGVNYGWPLVTYGTDYHTFMWPLNAHQGQHQGYEEAIHAWVPSIGVSNLIQLRGQLFPAWKDDFLVGALSTRSLYRLRIKDQRVIFSEPIALNHRIRDQLELADGRLLVWTDEAMLLEISPTSEMTGELLFGSMCQSCHWVHDGLSHRAGPDLFHILGKDVASSPGFSYSKSLQQVDGDWTAELLDRFLANPQSVAPGTSMMFPGIEDANQRQLLVEYLRQATPSNK